MTRSSSERRWSTSSNRAEAFKFPDFEQSLPLSRDRETLPVHKDQASSTKAYNTTTPSPNHLSKSKNSIVQGGRQRRESHVAWGNTNGHLVGPVGSRHVPQKSLSDAIRTIRTRKGSVSANAQELAEALKAPVSFQLVVCYVSRYPTCSAS